MNIKEKFFDMPTVPVKRILDMIKNEDLKITDETTRSYDSPTGRVYIGVAKGPLAEATNGYGYKGVLLQTDNRMFIQCAECGKWVRQLSAKHLKKHNLTDRQYKKKFSLLSTKGLVSDELSYSLEARARIRLIKSPNTLRKLDSKRAKTILKLREDKKLNKEEHNNRYNLCEKQLGFRLLEFIKNYKMLPSRSNKGEGSQITKALYRRFESVNNGFKYYQVPELFRQGTNVELLAPNNEQLFFNYNKDYNRNEVYNWIFENTPRLQAPNMFKD